VTGAFQLEGHTVCEVESFTVFKSPRKFVDRLPKTIGRSVGSSGKRHGVGQHWRQQGLGGMGTDDLALESVFDQLGHPADVVDVGVGEKQVVDFSGRNGPLVHGVLRIAPLGQAAVDHDVEAVELQQVAGAGDAVLGAEMGKAIVSHRSTQMNTDKMNFYHEGHEE